MIKQPIQKISLQEEKESISCEDNTWKTSALKHLPLTFDSNEELLKALTPFKHKVTIQEWESYLKQVKTLKLSTEPITMFNSNDDDISVIYQLKNGLVASGSRTNGDIKLWDFSNNAFFVEMLRGQGRRVKVIYELQDGRIACGSNNNDDGIIDLWDVSNGQYVTFPSSDIIRTIFQLQDGRLVVGNGSGTIILWNLETRQHVKTLRNGDVVMALCELRDGQLASGSEDRTIKIWNLSSGKHVTLTSHTHYVSTLCQLENGLLVSGSHDKTIRVWNLSKNQCTKILKGHSERVNIICPLQNDLIVSASGDKTLKVWNSSTGECLVTLEGHTDEVTTLCTLQDGRIVSGDSNGNIIVWDIGPQRLTKKDIDVLYTEKRMSQCINKNPNMFFSFAEPQNKNTASSSYIQFVKKASCLIL